MLQKLLSLAVGVTVVGHLFFRAQLRQLGRSIDRFVTWMAVAALLLWTCQLLYMLLTRH